MKEKSQSQSQSGAKAPIQVGFMQTAKKAKQTNKKQNHCDR